MKKRQLRPVWQFIIDMFKVLFVAGVLYLDIVMILLIGG